MQFIQKNKKRVSYALALALGSIATIFMIGKDNSDTVGGEYQIINKANADLPYSQGYYQNTYSGGGGGGADHDDSGSDGGSGGGGGGSGVSDEYT